MHRASVMPTIGGMTTSSAQIEDELRRRLGPVGVWLTLLGTRPAEEERASVAEIEDLGYGAFWFGEALSN
jgi:hypothetical protein